MVLWSVWQKKILDLSQKPGAVAAAQYISAGQIDQNLYLPQL